MTDGRQGDRYRLHRRALLLAAGGANLLAAPTASATGAPLKAPPTPASVPAAWSAAPVLPLWPGRMPGEGEFRPQPISKTWPLVFIRNTERPMLRVFRPRRANGGCVLVIPGGGYLFVSIANEGVDVAERLAALGYTVFVLTYRLPSEGWSARADVPLQDAQRAMRVIRARARDYGCDPARVAAVGFSAGGHLAASLATGADEAVYAPVDALDARSARPAAVGLIYPVVTLTKPHGHAYSRALLLGTDETADRAAQRSPELHVDAATPPIFLAHACDDRVVPVENSLMMLAACRAARRPVEAHLFQEGDHAFGVGFPGSPSGLWIDQFHFWLQRAGLT